MSPQPQPERFFSTVGLEETAHGFVITLDGRPVRTPQGNGLIVRGRALGEAIAAEWRALGAKIDFEKLPLTKLANTVIDHVEGKAAEVAEDIVRYASTDLVCYRAVSPQSLVTRQAELWDPVLQWVNQEYQALFEVTEGVTFVQQRPLSLDLLHDRLMRYSPFELAALHAMTSLLGSALLALAHAEGRLSLVDTWEAANVDENWQEDRWGQDYEATQRRERRYRDMAIASQFFTLARAA